MTLTVLLDPAPLSLMSILVLPPQADVVGVGVSEDMAETGGIGVCTYNSMTTDCVPPFEVIVIIPLCLPGLRPSEFTVIMIDSSFVPLSLLNSIHDLSVPACQFRVPFPVFDICKVSGFDFAAPEVSSFRVFLETFKLGGDGVCSLEIAGILNEIIPDFWP